MSRRIRFVILMSAVLLQLTSAWSNQSDQAGEPFKFFREYVGLNDSQIAQIRNGNALAVILKSPEADQVFVFGAVHVDSTPERYLKLAGDLDELRKLPGYLAIRKFSDPPRLADLEGFTLNDKDVKDLKDCKPGHCEVQLPAESMEEFQQSIRWGAPDAADQVNRLGQKMVLEALQAYISGGNDALGTYRDKKNPTEVADVFRSLLSRSKALPVYLPDLDRYLLEYPKFSSPNIESQFYWEKVNFGLKPTLRVVQTVIFRGAGASQPAYAVAEKQIYSSHYFETALDITICANGSPDEHGFYLITLKGSQQAGLTGLKGGIVRKVAVDKTRSSLEKALASIKQKLESQPN